MKMRIGQKQGTVPSQGEELIMNVQMRVNKSYYKLLVDLP